MIKIEVWYDMNPDGIRYNQQDLVYYGITKLNKCWYPKYMEHKTVNTYYQVEFIDEEHLSLFLLEYGHLVKAKLT